MKMIRQTRLWLTFLLLGLLMAGTAFGQETAMIRGTVADADTGAYLTGATVELVGTPYTGSSGSDGRYRIVGVEPGNYKLHVSYVGYADFTQDVTVSKAGEVIEAPVKMMPAAAITEEVKVTGARFGQSKSLNEQREATTIKNVISEELIKSFPDLNTAEVLQRVPGIMIQRDNGEGRFISIRGTQPQATQVLINGQQVAFSNGENRTVELDVIPAAQLSGIEVTKVITPDMDASAIGGAVNLKTRGAFDYDGRVLNFLGSLGTNSIADKTNYRGEVNYSDLFGADRNIGLSFGANFARTQRERHNNEQRWGDRDDVDGNTIPLALRDLDYQFSKNKRDRLGLNGRIDFRLNDDHYFYLDGTYNFRWDEQNRQNLRVRVDKGDYLSATEISEARFVKYWNDREETQKITSFNLGGDHQFTLLHWDWMLGTSSAFTKKDAGQLKPEWQLKKVDLMLSNLGTRTPDFTVTNGVDVFDGNNYEVDSIDLKYENTNSTIDTLSTNFEIPFQLGSDSGQIKFGGQYKKIDKDRKDRRTKWKWKGDEDLLVGQFEQGSDLVTLDNGYTLGRLINVDAFRKFFFANQGDGGFKGEDREDVNLGEPYDATEKIKAFYAMTTQNYGNLLVLAGVRYENFDLDYTASNLVLNDKEFVSNTLENVKRSYDFWFPNLQFRWRPNEQTNIRLAYSEGISPPNFFDSMPYSFIDIDAEEGTRGNPQLDPEESQNIDFMYEYYFQGIGLFSGGVFYKQLDKFVFRTKFTEQGGEFDGFDIEHFVNGGGADLYGIEINWQQQFTFLPGFWSGFGIFANYTYTDSRNIDLGPDTERTTIDALPQQMRNVLNLALTYERNAIVSRLAMNYTDKWIEEVGDSEAQDEWRDATTTFDFTASYRFESGFDVFFQANNLTNEKRFNYLGVPSRSFEYGITGRSYELGVKWSY